MSNTVDGEGTVVNLEHNPIAMPYSTNRGTIEVLTGKDKVVDDIGRQGQVRALVIEGNKTLAKLAMDANNEIAKHQTKTASDTETFTRKEERRAKEKLEDDDDELWDDYAKRRDKILNNTKLEPEVKERRLKRLKASYTDLSDTFQERFENNVMKSR
ncbi:hypothetical protein LP123_08450 [Moraxella bovis]|uniref:Uncharacterized protein n=1 Tax=Moraxella bovis TaxID=476 RepID=A0AAQ2QAL0_MORBO|nr:hypothetical protein [Moraxella bovis]AWY20523.1 hypothetical protein DQF64_08475 [Moraxella bovis]UYZ76800.1 hypothetical protein LP093_05825 [Moraxella bovis]UYZ77245.1 hypothetical protein LP115_07990 [Moraxella bovis]UYZ82272.1 hypothetical protein LP113_06140 [Moraxella bovis]UYZ85732.1 hypothetical protein LP094_08035 [Moraxella bovis]